MHRHGRPVSEKFEQAVERGREVDALIAEEDPRVEIAANALSRGKLPESLHLHSDARAVVEALFPPSAPWSDTWIIERHRDALRDELRARRACLVGAKETVEQAAATLSNAESIDLARTALGGPLQDRIALLEQAIAQTDAALGEVKVDAGRVETGVVRFGDDWPGYFIRGDDALALVAEYEQGNVGALYEFVERLREVKSHAA